MGGSLSSGSLHIKSPSPETSPPTDPPPTDPPPQIGDTANYRQPFDARAEGHGECQQGYWDELFQTLAAADPHRFTYFPSRWEKFADGTDNLELGGFTPVNRIRGEHVVFLASFHSNDTALTQFFAMIALLESFIESLTVVLPFYPTATMERVVKEGVVATASTMARIFNCLPSCGRPTCLMIYDLHTLQNRFYLSGHCIAQLESTIPLLKEHMLGSSGHADGANAAGSDTLLKENAEARPPHAALARVHRRLLRGRIIAWSRNCQSLLR